MTIISRRAVAISALGFLAAIAVAATLVLGFGPSHTAAQPTTWFNGSNWQPVTHLATADNFTLPDQARKPLTFRRLRGKVVILNFTSSVCVQQCPLVARSISKVERSLRPLSGRTVIVNVSVDPESDTRATVKAFAHKMGFDGLTWYYVWAPRRIMQPIWRHYYIYVPTPPPIFKVGRVVHTAGVVLVDQNGKVRGEMNWPFRTSDLARGIRGLVDSSS
jgi:protein SCO1/2